MKHRFDIDAYLERIGYDGSRAASLCALQAIHLNHARTIPFENLNPLLGWPVRLDAWSIQQKLVHDRRGGYCFEHNLLLSHALTALGFEVTWLAARVLWNAADETKAPRGHMLLLVDLDDRAYIVDAGFGGLTPTAPLRLEVGLEQSTPHEVFRFLRDRHGFVLQADIRNAWSPLYRFDLQEQLLADYEVTSWYLSNHPDSHFVRGLIAARPDVDRRFALRNNELTVHHTAGWIERRTLTSAGELRAALQDLFHLNVPDAPELRAALERLVARAA